MVAPNQKVKINLNAFEETMLIPLWARGIEQKQTSPIIRDENAAEIIDTLDYDFSIIENNKTLMDYLNVRLVTRGKILDDYVRDFMTDYPRGTVVELGCGLSTRFNRVDNGEVNWYCLDLPQGMALREKLIPAENRCEYIVDSMLESNWIQRVVREEGPCMLIVEGVLPYFERKDVRRFFDLISRYFGGGRIAFDTQTELYRRLLKPGKMIHANQGQSGLEFHWVIKDIDEIEIMDERLALRESRTLPESGASIMRRLAWKIRLLETMSVPFWGRYRVSVFDIAENDIKL
ncbi:Leucine carboxyl methyltransferase [Poriferisphaera corsica]|uniref:Leucine carboxyl methyltransferase n=1 Tax=Poriferisphaera corsica TaxID=2528020 RepID=A0A517YQB5_9BACT|nr:class I SAM-dependent methyltransferase [Poriferisphaera corsica]QDU32416.1 Leucine carboxyl methyltransferase [Poriferisphaera corsica]